MKDQHLYCDDIQSFYNLPGIIHKAHWQKTHKIICLSFYVYVKSLVHTPKYFSHNLLFLPLTFIEAIDIFNLYHILDGFQGINLKAGFI